MDWAYGIERHRQALLPVVAAIVALVGGRDGEGPVARGVRRAALALLRPAESAVRRLIVIAARALPAGGPAAASAVRPFPQGLARSGERKRRPAFRLFDPPQRFGRMIRVAPSVPPRGGPRIRTFGPASARLIGPPPAPPPPPPVRQRDPDAPVESGALRLRLAALEYALADLRAQARRLQRRLARRKAPNPQALPPSPLRIGRPPGWRRDPSREVDVVLKECHGLALVALRPNTS